MQKCDYCGTETAERFCSQVCADNSVVFHIIENLTEEIDLFYKATSYPWKVLLTSRSYESLKNHPGTHWVPEVKAYLPKDLFYEKDGHEYLVCIDNHNMPFIIHARVADKNAAVDYLKLDDLNRPNIVQEHADDFDSYESEI